MSDWISVEDRLPDSKEPIVYCSTHKTTKGKIGVGVAYWTVSDKWNPEMSSEYCKTGFTHWMPLPEPPE